MSISLTGLATPGGEETRLLANIKVEHNNQTYDWQAFVPFGVDYGAYLNERELVIKAEIDAKEAEWQALDPKTREIEDIGGEVIIEDIQKSEIVRPEIPDYYAKRRKEYPSIGDQLDAFWKGGDDATAMLAKIQAVKDKYPKP